MIYADFFFRLFLPFFITIQNYQPNIKGGLIFFLGNKDNRTVNETVIITMTVLLVVANSIFLFTSIIIFGQEYMHDRKKAAHKRATGYVSIKKQKSVVEQKETKSQTKVLPTTTTALSMTGVESNEARAERAANRAWGKEEA